MTAYEIAQVREKAEAIARLAREVPLYCDALDERAEHPAWQALALDSLRRKLAEIHLAAHTAAGIAGVKP